MSMATAKALHRLHWQFRHLALAAAEARERERQEAERRLREIVNRKK
jgi:hypothetical protein